MTKIMLLKDRNTFNTKWVCNFASQLVGRGYEVVLVADSYAKAGKPVPIDERVRLLNLSGRTGNFLKNIWFALRCALPIAPLRYRKLFATEKPDVIICYFNHDLINATFMQRHNIPVVMMMHNPPNEIFANVRKGIRRFLTDAGFKKTAMVQVLMQGFAREVTNVFPTVKVTVIPNQVSMPAVQADLNIEHKRIIHVAQIAEQFKRQHLLIDAFALIAADFPEWNVAFFGKVKSGKHKKYYLRLLAKVKALGLEKRISFNGYSSDITAEYLQSDIVTMPSFSEGFGYGMADGLALGLPGVGFASAPAINELVIDGKTGFLVNDVRDYADKLAALMRDKDLRIKMGAAARADMACRYAPQIVIDAWDKLIKEVANP